MAAELIQNALFTTLTIFIVVIAIVLIGGIVFFLVRSNAGRREREGRMRARMLEMEREAQFAAAADRAPQSRSGSETASQVSRLFAEYLSVRVLAVYAGRAGDSRLGNLLRSDLSEMREPALPLFVEASLLQPAKARLERLTLLAGSGAASTGQLAQPGSPPAEDYAASSVVEQGEASSAPETGTPAVSPEEVLLLPWRASFQWSGLIVTAVSEEVTAEALDAYREPIARLTERLAVALELESSDAALSAAEERLARTAALSRSLISCIEDPSPLNAIVREVKSLVEGDSAALWRVEAATGMVTMVASDGLKTSEFLPLPLGQGLAGSVAQCGETLALQDAPSDPRCIFPRESRESGIVSYLGAPLVADGKIFGVIEIHSATTRWWSRDEQRLLEAAAKIVSELIRTSDTRGNRLRIESAYLGLSEALQRLRSAEEVKEAVVEVLGHAIGASRVLIVELNETGETKPVKHEYRRPQASPALGAKFGEALASRVIAEATTGPIEIADSQHASLMGLEQVAELGVVSELALPIRIDGKTCAIVYIHQCDRVREWEPEVVEFSDRVARQLSLSLSNLHALELASNEAAAARAELAELSAKGGPARIEELEQKIQSLERVLEHSRNLEEQARRLLENASALEAKSRAEAEAARRAEDELRQQVHIIASDRKRVQSSAQQLLEINRLKSEFIVNAGREIEASLQSVLGAAELLERGSYGALTAEQHEAVRGLYGAARRIKSDVDWLIEYGSTRSRRLQPSEKG